MTEQFDRYFIVIPPGLEPVTAKELHQLDIPFQNLIPGGIEFTGNLRQLYLANLWLRSPSRILVRLGDEMTARDFPTLFQRLAKLPWGRFVKPGSGCQIRVTTRVSRLNHSHRIAETCRAAMARALGQESPEVRDGQTVYLRLEENRCQVSIDSSGRHLHCRGYRHAVARAPLRENLAAACLLAAGYDGSQPLLDLMTGSGTFAVEAALIALRRAPGLSRHFAFMEWPRYRQGLWQQLLNQARRSERPSLPNKILAFDNNPRAVAVAAENFAFCGIKGLVQLECRDMRSLQPEGENGMLICNPPYGERLGHNAALNKLYRALGQLYGVTFADWQGAVVCPENGLCELLGIPLSLILRFNHGGLRVSLQSKY